jgi:hypothetical protein
VDGRRVGIEMVEIVDPQHRKKVQGQPWYLAEVRKAFEVVQLDASLRGMAIELFDQYKDLPAARSLVQDFR